MTCCPNLLTSATECEFYKGFLKNLYLCSLGFPGGSVGKESACNMGDLGWEDSLEKGKATHSSILAWRIPWTI